MKGWTTEGFGKHIAAMSAIYGFVSRILLSMKIGIGIVAWLKTDEGKKEAENAVRSLGEKYLKTIQIVQVKHIIDCDANPFCPDGLKVYSHKKDGQLEWSLAKIPLYLFDIKKSGGVTEGKEFRKDVRSLVLNLNVNANVLDYLLVHKALRAVEWNEIFFWGTIYCNDIGRLCVRCLGWHDGKLTSYHRWLDCILCDSHLAALPAK